MLAVIRHDFMCAELDPHRRPLSHAVPCLSHRTAGRAGPASTTELPATPPLLPTAEPAATRTPRPTSTSAVSDPTDGPSATPALVLTAEPTATRTSRPTSTPVVGEGIGAVAATVQLPNQGGLFPAVGAGGVWVPGQGILAGIDPATMEVVSTITLDGGNHVPGPYAVAVKGVLFQ